MKRKLPRPAKQAAKRPAPTRETFPYERSGRLFNIEPTGSPPAAWSVVEIASDGTAKEWAERFDTTQSAIRAIDTHIEASDLEGTSQ